METLQNTSSKKADSKDEPASIIFARNITMEGELPATQSIPELFDEMDYQQAVQCYLWALPLVELEMMKQVQEKTFGATDNDLVVYNSYEDKLGILTGNATTPYI